MVKPNNMMSNNPIGSTEKVCPANSIKHIEVITNPVLNMMLKV